MRSQIHSQNAAVRIYTLIFPAPPDPMVQGMTRLFHLFWNSTWGTRSAKQKQQFLQAVSSSYMEAVLWLKLIIAGKTNNSGFHFSSFYELNT